MRTPRMVSPARRLLLRYFHAYRQIFFYAALFLAGILAGALFLKSVSPETLQKLSLLVGQFAQKRGEQDFWQTLASSFFSAALMLGILFICGFCTISQPVVLLLPFFRGLGYGYQAGYLYARNGLAGMGYAALLLMPYMMVSTLILIVGCGEAFTMSCAYGRAARAQNGGRPVNPRSYCFKFAVLLVLSLAASLLDAGMTAVFSGLFQLV